MNARNLLTIVLVVPGFMAGCLAGALATDLVGGEQPNLLSPQEALERFRLHPDYRINLYASEVDFPIQSPAAMTFDSQGRLWVGNIPTQPHARPGVALEDSVVVLEDTDRDGVADRHHVFAKGLYLPLGLAVADGGRTLYVTDEPHLVRLRDLDGDGAADEKEIVLSGFGTEDNHHFISAFQWGPDGRLYFGQGLFLNTQVETPYGPVRAYEAAVFRYDPRDNRLGVYASFGWSNVWGIIFDSWGRPFLNDASPALNYYLSHTASNFTYPKPGKYSDHFRKRDSVSFTPSGRRPSCGNEFLLSDHFPEEVRGWYVTNQMKGWHGIRWYQLEDSGSGVSGSQPYGEENELLTTSDIMFRPTALQIGPDGALYVLDYYNPIVGHTTYSFRDARHIKTHGRVWRITHKDRPLVWQPKIDGEPVETLLGHLEKNESYRTAYFARRELQQRDASEVGPTAEKWLAGASPGDEGASRRLVETLWLFEGLNHYDFDLLRAALRSEKYLVRAAGQRVLRYWQVNMKPDEVLALLESGVRDKAAHVRLEALVNLGYFADPEKALPIAAAALEADMDDGMRNAAHDTLAHLVSLTGGVEKASAEVDAFLVPFARDEELLARKMDAVVAEEILARTSVGREAHRAAIAVLAASGSGDSVLKYLVDQLNDVDPGDPRMVVLEGLLISWPPAEVAKNAEFVASLLADGRPTTVRTAALATLIRAKAAEGPGRPAASDQLLASAVSRAGRGKSPGKYFETLAAGLRPGSGVDASLARTLMGAVANFPERDAEASKLLGEAADRYAGTNLVLSFAALDAMMRIPMSARSPEYRTKTLSRVTVSATPDLKFTPAEFVVTAGSAVELVFRNPDNLYHNLVIVKPGSTEAVGLKADLMAGRPDGLERHYVPDDANVLHWTPQITIGMARTYSLRFFAPEEPGEYPYICTFPGHWRVMRGIMRVVPAKGVQAAGTPEK